MKKETDEMIYELKYTGHLMNAESLFLHYGFANWSDVSEKKMKKLKSCYKIEISLPAGNELNFCFRANENDWDNNDGNNYWFNSESVQNYANVEINAKDAAPKALAKVATATKTVTKETAKKATTTKSASAKKSTVTKTTATKAKAAATKTTKK